MCRRGVAVPHGEYHHWPPHPSWSYRHPQKKGGDRSNPHPPEGYAAESERYQNVATTPGQGQRSSEDERTRGGGRNRATNGKRRPTPTIQHMGQRSRRTNRRRDATGTRRGGGVAPRARLRLPPHSGCKLRVRRWMHWAFLAAAPRPLIVLRSMVVLPLLIVLRSRKTERFIHGFWTKATSMFHYYLWPACLCTKYSSKLD